MARSTAIPRLHRSQALRPRIAPTLDAAPAPWHLLNPISRAVVLSEQNSILIAGGLDQAGQSASGVYRLEPAQGGLSLLGTLPTPVHDAAGAIVQGKVVTFGGGEAVGIASVQAFSAPAGGQVIGQLPAPRSDLVSVSAGKLVYLIGGYDGTTLSRDVLATADGVHFTTVAKLAVPVRYPAAAILTGHIWVFGGQQGAQDTAAIQEVNPRSHTTRIVGRLPEPVSHAAVTTFGTYIYLLGGRVRGAAIHNIWSFDPVSKRVRPAGTLPAAVSDAGVATIGQTAYLIGGEDTRPTDAAVILRVASRARPPTVAGVRFFQGRMLIADRGNNRLVLVDAGQHVLWTYPSPSAPAPPGGFYYPDDAFFVNHGKSIIVNEEGNAVVVQIAFPSGRLEWSYGHPGIFGSTTGYLHQPDDAYVLKNGQVVVADDANCRVLFINPAGAIVHQIGTTGLCAHQPPAGLGSPNGDTPLANGNVLISEINGSWISEYTPAGQLAWTVHLPIAYPSDPQQIGPDRYLVVDYSRPGGMYEFSRSGRILWSYIVPSGDGMLDHPSLAEVLPNGLIAANDDYRHRVILINPVTKTIVWQYGHPDLIGTDAGYLNTPDGFDLLAPDGQTPTHLATR